MTATNNNIATSMDLTALDARITALRTEAGAAGDQETVALCDRALDDENPNAIAACEEILRDAEMADTDED